MKKNNTKNSFVRISIAAVCFAIAFFAYSCKKDIKTDSQNAALSLPVAQAKSWYESAYPKKSLTGKSVSSLDSNEADFSQLVSPDWNDPAIYSRFEADVVEMPMLGGSVLSASLNGGAIPQKNSRSWFLLLNELGKYNAYIMTIIADDDYLNGDLNKLDNNKYNKRDSDFSGMVIYTTPIGKLVNGWKYKNGVAISQMPGDEAAATNAAHVKTTEALKTNKTVVVETTTCITWTQTSSYTNSAGQTVTNAPVTLSTQCTNSYSYYDDGSGGGGGSGVTTGTSSGGGSGTSTTPVPPTPCTPGSGSAVENVKNPDGLSINGLKVQVVQPVTSPIDGGNGFPPPSGAVPCPTGGIIFVLPPLKLPRIIDNLPAKYACAKRLLAQLTNLNSDIARIIYQAFGVSSTTNNIIFSEGSLADFPAGSKEDGFTIGYSIAINPSVLSNSSNEYRLVTFYHEALHAFLNLERQRLGQDAFSTKYPEILVTASSNFSGNVNDPFDYSLKETSYNSPVDKDPQHRTMAEYFTNELRDAIHAYNPNFPIERATALARFGIFKDPSITYYNTAERDVTKGISVGTKCTP